MLKIILTILPVLPTLIRDVDAEVDAIKDHADTATQAKLAAKALTDLAAIVAVLGGSTITQESR